MAPPEYETDSAVFLGVDDATAALDGAIDVCDLLARTLAPPRFIVDPIVPASSLGLFTGDTGSAKTAFALHLAICVASGKPVASRFVTEPSRVLYLNGEMGAADLHRYVHQAALSVGAPNRGQLIFEGVDGWATFQYGDPSAQNHLEDLIGRHRPALVVIDTLRALFAIDENDPRQIRDAFSWLRSIINAMDTTILVAHHLRKISAVSNSDRERVSGSRDLIGAVDFHLAVRSRDEAPMHALKLSKTRSSTPECPAGTVWPITAKLVQTDAGISSTFEAADPERVERESVEDAGSEILAKLEATGPLTIDELGAKGGSKKRAFDAHRASGEIVECGKRGRKTLYDVAGRVPVQTSAVDG